MTAIALLVVARLGFGVEKATMKRCGVDGRLRGSRGRAGIGSGRGEGARTASEGIEEAEERPQPRVPGLDAPANGPGTYDDLAGDADEGLAKGAELHGEQPAALLAVDGRPAGRDWQQGCSKAAVPK